MTPEEQAEEFLEEHMFGSEWHIGELAKVIRAAENDALERAAALADEGAWRTKLDVPEFLGFSMGVTRGHVEAAKAIRALKHPVSE